MDSSTTSIRYASVKMGSSTSNFLNHKNHYSIKTVTAKMSLVKRLSHKMKTSLIGSLPKVGIRPTIDGRLGGVRESLEKQTMDMNQPVPKAVWGFNGPERPGAVYLAAVLAGHSQKGIPAFSSMEFAL